MGFCSKPLEKIDSLPTTKAVKQLSGAYRNDETSFLWLCGTIPYWQRRADTAYSWGSASVNITRHFQLFWAADKHTCKLSQMRLFLQVLVASGEAQARSLSRLCRTLSFVPQVRGTRRREQARSGLARLLGHLLCHYFCLIHCCLTSISPETEGTAQWQWW